MKSYPTKIPKIIQNVFSKFTWNICTEEKEIYLTFDDGPIPEITPWVLKTLSDYNAKATFFCIGENIQKHPTIFHKILNEKHAIGNHTYNHLRGWETYTPKYIENINQVEEIFKLEINKKRKPNSKQPTANSQQLTTNLFRPPYGKIKPKQVRKIGQKGYKIVMWDILSGDFDQTLKKESCLKNVIKHTKKGSIIVFHDSEKAFKNLQYTLPKTLEYFSEKGYVFKSLHL